VAKRTAITDTSQTAAVATELRVVLGQLTRRLREQSDTADLTRSQSSVLSRVERDGPTTMTALAQAEGIRPQSMGAIITVLETAGLLIRTADPADGRKSLLSLSPAAGVEVARGRLAREDWLFRTIRARLSPAEEDQLAKSVELLRRLAGSD
jgi:DNA-binding MarR family transcriptional regulator